MASKAELQRIPPPSSVEELPQTVSDCLPDREIIQACPLIRVHSEKGARAGMSFALSDPSSQQHGVQAAIIAAEVDGILPDHGR